MKPYSESIIHFNVVYFISELSSEFATLIEACHTKPSTKNTPPAGTAESLAPISNCSHLRQLQLQADNR